eukprot:CAMPEP_0174716854 /NCGR_PEP_ID=MMETSP1094-20130205/24974_1 /TAXON_ID=156173 /ORGANISM="Chrysochromulina brevifilum, Strain UTEX LB 985" /LENGTH=140 /DNA_ID=CAMNT_0015916701 /DNA_START=210 /DNA_END=630 /DNA_ORIENTATION=+
MSPLNAGICHCGLGAFAGDGTTLVGGYGLWKPVFEQSQARSAAPLTELRQVAFEPPVLSLIVQRLGARVNRSDPAGCPQSGRVSPWGWWCAFDRPLEHWILWFVPVLVDCPMPMAGSSGGPLAGTGIACLATQWPTQLSP